MEEAAQCVNRLSCADMPVRGLVLEDGVIVCFVEQ